MPRHLCHLVLLLMSNKMPRQVALVVDEVELVVVLETCEIDTFAFGSVGALVPKRTSQQGAGEPHQVWISPAAKSKTTEALGSKPVRVPGCE